MLNPFKLRHYFFWLVFAAFAILISSCNSNKTYYDLKDDDEYDIEQAKELGTKVYTNIVSGDSTQIAKWLEVNNRTKWCKDIKQVVAERNDEYGELVRFEVFDASTHVYRSNKNDTLQYTVYVKAVYEYATCEDEITLEKTGKKQWVITDYDFALRSYYSCGFDEIDALVKSYQGYTLAVINQDKDRLKEICKNNPSFADSLADIGHDTFDGEIEVDTIQYIDGYIRSECGAKNYANGFLVYEVQYNDTNYVYFTFLLTRHNDESDFNVYSVFSSPVMNIDVEKDIELLKDISKEIFSMIKKKDIRGFYEAFHEDLKIYFDDKNMSDVEEMVNQYADLGKFDDFYEVRTFSTGGTSVNDYSFYIVILQLENKEGDYKFLEMAFKPDSGGKFMLLNSREL